MYQIKYVGGPGETSDLEMAYIHQMEKICFEGEKPYAYVNKQERCHWWVIMYEGKRIGFSGLELFKTWNPKFGFIFLTGVLPAYRNQGLKKRLVRTMEKKLRTLDIYRMVSYASYDNLPSANSLISLGYKLYQPSDPDWGTKWAYFFRKDLWQ